MKSITSALGARWIYYSAKSGERSVSRDMSTVELGLLDPHGRLHPIERHQFYTESMEKNLAQMPIHSAENSLASAAGVLKAFLEEH